MDSLSISTSSSTQLPTEFRLIIDCFSTLSTYSSMERFESCEFDACDYKWKLALYTRGNKEKIKGKDHISFYLISVDSNSLDLDFDKDILVSFSLFVLDQIRDKYFKVQGVSRFHALMKAESGFDKFIPLKIFMDPSNGYLLDDTCIFGAEVCFVKEITPESLLTMNKSISTNTVRFEYTWKIEKFSELEDKAYDSQKFTGGGYEWKLVVFPKGNKDGKGHNSLSLFLALADPSILLPDEVVHTTFRLQVLDQIKGYHRERVTFGGDCMDASTKGIGWNQFMTLRDLNKSADRFLANDTCIVTAVISVGDEESIKNILY